MTNLSYMLDKTPLIMNITLIFFISLPTKNNKFNPINLMLILILITIFFSIKMNMMTNSWSSMILFLIMVGGLMIIFMYILSLTNNEMFTFNFKYVIINLIKISPLIMIIMLSDINLYFWNNSNTWSNNNFNLNFYEMYESIYDSYTSFLMNYLFYCLICIMNICYKLKNPLRQLFF